MSVPSLQELALKKVLLDPTTDLCRLPKDSSGALIGPRAVRKVVETICGKVLSEIYGGIHLDLDFASLTERFSTTYERMNQLILQDNSRESLRNASIASAYRQIRFGKFLNALRASLAPRGEEVLNAFDAQFNLFSSVYRTERESFSEVIAILDRMQNNLPEAERERMPDIGILIRLAGETEYWEGLDDLITRGLDPNISDAVSWDYLLATGEGGLPERIQLLADAGVNLSRGDYAYQTVLHVAARRGDRNAMQMLIGAGADLNIRDLYGQTPLYRAVEQGDSDIVKMLIGAGADLSIPTLRGQTTLHAAAARGHSGIVKMLIDAGADRNIQDGSGATALHVAARRGDRNVMQMLIDAGADRNIQDGSGATALHVAARRGDRNVMQMLIDAGADLFVRDQDGRKPLLCWL